MKATRSDIAIICSLFVGLYQLPTVKEMTDALLSYVLIIIGNYWITLVTLQDYILGVLSHF